MKQLVLIKKHQNGFTLIEITVALVLLSITMLLLFGSLYTSNKYWQIGESKIERNDETRLVSQFIRKHLSQITPILWVNQDKKKLLFVGKQNELSFTSSLPSHRGGGGIHSLTLKVLDINENKQLGMSYSLLTPDTVPFEQRNEKFVSVINNIDSIDLSYFGKEKTGENSRWYDTWENNDFLPQLVRIKINAKNTNTNWPLIDIPIKAVYLRNQPEFMILAKPS